MIASLKGTIAQVEENALVVEVGGVGMRVLVPMPLRSRVHPGESAALFTHLVVREDSLTLFGFETQAERDVFMLLLGASGVGPKSALAVLSTLTVEAIQHASAAEDADAFAIVPGISKVTGQKIVLHLHKRLKPTDALLRLSAASELDSEVLDALTALGYSVVEAQTAIQSLPKDAPGDTAERLRLALTYFRK